MAPRAVLLVSPYSSLRLLLEDVTPTVFASGSEATGKVAFRFGPAAATPSTKLRACHMPSARGRLTITTTFGIVPAPRRQS